MFSMILSPLRFFSARREPIHMCNEVSNNDMAITISLFSFPFLHIISRCVFTRTNTFQYHTLWCQFFLVMLFSDFYLLLQLFMAQVIGKSNAQLSRYPHYKQTYIKRSTYRSVWDENNKILCILICN